MKNYRAPEEAFSTKTVTYLIIFALLAVLAWASERDSAFVADTQFIGYCGE
jgi:hypothetical protein